MEQAEFPDFVKKLPEADLPINDLRGYLLQSDFGQVLFLECDTEVSMPEHSHGDQWGVVVDGEVELTIGSQTRRYTRGDSYFIPAGTKHKARLLPGFKAIDYFADKERYKPRARSV